MSSLNSTDFSKGLFPVNVVPIQIFPEKITSALDEIWTYFLEEKNQKIVREGLVNVSPFLMEKFSHIAVHIVVSQIIQHLADLSVLYFSRPKLVTEARYVHLFDRIANAKSTNLMQLFLTTVVQGGFASWHAENLINKKGKSNLFDMGLRFFSCATLAGIGTFRWKTEHFVTDLRMCMNQPLSPGFVKLVSRILGTCYGLMCGFPHLKGLEFPVEKPEEKPIVSSEVHSVVNSFVEIAGKLQTKKAILQNLLLYGPPGTGKTMIAKHIARNSSMNYVMVNGGSFAELLKSGEHVFELNNLFMKINKSSAPTILFIDEAESLCRHRGCFNDKIERIELLNAFLKWTGENSKHVMIILATDRIEDLDPAVLNRMDYKLEISLPKQEERRKILQNNIAKMFTPQEALLFNLKSLVKSTEGFSGRNLVKILNTILIKKTQATDEKLTKEIIDSSFQEFIEQEEFFLQKEKRASPDEKISSSRERFITK